MLKAKVALITGSTSGIGLGIARGLAQSGAHIVLNGFGDRSEIEELRAGIQAASDVEVIYNAADMSRPDEIVEMITETQKTLGSVDIVVNNAGIQRSPPSRNFRWTSGMRSSPSISPRRFTPSAPRSRS